MDTLILLLSSLPPEEALVMAQMHLAYCLHDFLLGNAPHEFSPPPWWHPS